MDACRSFAFLRKLPIDVSPVSNLVNLYNSLMVIHSVNDTVVALSDAIAIPCGKFLAAGQTGIFGKGPDNPRDAFYIAGWKPPQFALRTALHSQVVHAHLSDDSIFP
jgi:hypothetical protein